VTRSRDKEDVQVLLFDQPIEMYVDEVKTGRRAPMAEQARLDMLDFERFPQQRVSQEIDLADR
jgi:hypothetical protein